MNTPPEDNYNVTNLLDNPPETSEEEWQAILDYVDEHMNDDDEVCNDPE